MTQQLTKPLFAKQKEEDLFQELRKRVNETVKNVKPYRKNIIYVKAFLFPLLYFTCYVLALSFAPSSSMFYFFYFLMGVFLVLNYLNIVHEAIHSTLFKSNALNKLYIHLFDVMGANSYIFKIRHVRFHHNYPNVMGWDTDFEQSPLARVFPHGKFSALHRYQHIYLPFIYPLYLFNWLLVRDFKDFYKKHTTVKKLVSTIPFIEHLKLFLFKLLFVFYLVVLPVLLCGISYSQTFTGFLIMMFTASIFSLIVLLAPHASLESEYPMPDEEGHMPTSWLVHQLSCTNDVKNDNWFVRFFMGSFNYHVAHHLFPHVNHIYYPEVTRVIKTFARKHELPYRSFSLATSLKNHYLLLKHNAFHENIFEETM